MGWAFQYLPGIILLVWISTSVKGGGIWPDDWDVVNHRMYESAFKTASYQPYGTLLKLLELNGSFSDLTYAPESSSSFRTHGRRLSALAYHHLRGVKDLEPQLIKAFNYITYDAPQNTDSNWWGHLIGTPLSMWEGVVLASRILDQQLIFDFLDRYWVKTPKGPVWMEEEGEGSLAGGNFGPRALLGEIEGLIRGTYKRVHSEVAVKMHKELAERNPYKGNGVRPDGCLHQHNQEGGKIAEGGRYLEHTLSDPYNGAYGKEMLRHISRMMTWYTNTTLDFEDDIIEGIYSTYFDCQQWVFRGNVIEPTLAGRKIPSGSAITFSSVKGLIHDTGFNLLKLGRHQTEVIAVLQRSANVKPDPKYALVGHRHFFSSDLSVQQRREYYASVRILSNRTVRPESWLNANIEGYFQVCTTFFASKQLLYLADGFMTILVDGNEYGNKKNEVFQVYDWARVPSVTNQYTTNIPGFKLGVRYARHFFNDATFSGGVTDGLIGLASMVYDRPHVPLQALKSWFFFDDVIVVVGSGITMDPEYVTQEDVATTLTQIVFDGDYVVSSASGEKSLKKGTSNIKKPSWMFHRNVGYVFLNGDEHLHTSAETRTHNDKTLDVFMAWITHTADPVNATLAYAVLPATSIEATRQFSNNETVEVITQETNKHVVCHHYSKAVGASLVDGGKATVASCGGSGPLEIEVDTPCLILATIEETRASDARIALSVADPQQIYDVINISITFEGRQVKKTINLPGDRKRGSSTTTSITV